MFFNEVMQDVKHDGDLSVYELRSIIYCCNIINNLSRDYDHSSLCKVGC